MAGREAAAARFEHLYVEHGRAVLAYAVRRVDDPEDAADVLAETFLVAWRRLDDVPSAAEARLWLYGVARNVLANQQRSKRRREQLAERLREDLRVALDGAPGPAGGVVGEALAQLGPEDREILRLRGWEELAPGEIATVLGISRIAARSRLHRAKGRLRAALRAAAELDGVDASILQEAR